MTFPVLVEACDGQFTASLVGVPNVRVVGPTRSQAVEALKAVIEHRIALGELLSLEIDAIGVSSLAGQYNADPTLRTICDDAYQMRDAERDQ
jgi:predicted RNase H-like HicB family nuclease